MSRQTAKALRCSFCHKSQDSVPKLISGPESPRAYICSECVKVCVSILDDDQPLEAGAVATKAAPANPLLAHPLTLQVLTALERWLRAESLGTDAAKEFVEFHTAAVSWMYLPR